MTAYEKKSTEGAIKFLKNIIKDSEAKRKNAEEQLIKEIRTPYHLRKSNSQAYRDALMNTIEVESTCISYMESEITKLEAKMRQ
jgi:hypothetical protein